MILFQGYPTIFTLVYKLSNPAVGYIAAHLGNNKWKEDIFICWDLTQYFSLWKQRKPIIESGAEWVRTQIHLKILLN